MLSTRRGVLLVALASFVPLAGCGGAMKTQVPEDTVIGECSFACDASGAWILDDGATRLVADIWMKPDGIHVRNRETEAVRFYRTIALDTYQHDDGEVFEFQTDDLMIRRLPSGKTVEQRRLAS